MNESEYSSIKIVKKVVNMDLEQIHSEVGEWGFIYLSFLKHIVTLLIGFFFLSLAILIVYICEYMAKSGWD